MSGKINNAAKTDAARPPMTARPRGAVCSPASLKPSAMGIIPAIIAMLVINIGRNLIPADVMAAFSASLNFSLDYKRFFKNTTTDYLLFRITIISFWFKNA